MPRFQIKRKTREPKPEVVPKVEEEESDEDMNSPSISAEENEPLEEAFETLKTAEKAENNEYMESEPEYEPRRRARETRVANMYTTPVPNRNFEERRAPSLRQMYREPRRIDFAKPSRCGNGRPKLQFRSGYGPNASSMTTQDKARQLYMTCF